MNKIANPTMNIKRSLQTTWNKENDPKPDALILIDMASSFFRQFQHFFGLPDNSI
jgi:hypothetical protein